MIEHEFHFERLIWVCLFVGCLLGVGLGVFIGWLIWG